jgi:purine-cytosine permease-like protein
MIGAIAAIFLAIWFYKSALDEEKEPVPSAALGLIVYFVVAFAWTLAVTPTLRDFISHNPSSLLGIVIAYAHVAVGIACAIWVKSKHFKPIEDD